MKCPKCGCDNNYVISHSQKEMAFGYVRSRKCQSCGEIFTTIERVGKDERTNSKR